MRFEIKVPSSSNKTLRFPDHLIAKLEHLAFEADISFNELVRQCLEYALANMGTEAGNEA